MFKVRPEGQAAHPRLSWRAYQTTLRKNRPVRSKRTLVITVALSVLGLLSLYAGFSFSAHAPAPVNQAVHLEENDIPSNDLISKRDMQLLLEGIKLNSLTEKKVNLHIKGHTFHLQTSLDTELQSFLMDKLDRRNSRYIGIVVMNADNGRILSLAGFDKTDSENNPCLHNTFPAASIFKMVTAAAALDHCGYTPNSRMAFNGYKHTLYKRQLKEEVNRYTNKMTLMDSFAQSVNPVFGKLGSLKLGQAVLEEYATAFGFNQPIDFEVAVPQSHLYIKPDPYHWAEIASGFNNETTLSPLHGAVMATAVINQGRMVAPSVVEALTDENGTVLYRFQSSWQGRAMTTQASNQLARMMETTIQSGTSRKSFRDQRRNRVLADLEIGGKTGSIFNRAHDLRFDWFVGFAQKKKNKADPVAVAVLVAHEEYIGIRASEYARIAIIQHYSQHLAHNINKVDSENSGG